MRSKLACLLLPLLTSTALANDSMVTIDAGGLVLERTDAVRMVSENLRISQHEVVVDYVFENLTNLPVVATIGFPLPAYQAGDDFFDAQGVDLQAPFSPLTTLVGGAAQQADIHMTVTTAEGEDITEIASALDLLPTSYAHLPDEDAIARTKAKLDAAGDERGLVELSSSWESWRYQLTYVWHLELAPNETVDVHHAYFPLAGGYPISPLAQRHGESYRQVLTNQYCLDDAQWQVLSDAAAQGPEGHAGYIFEVGYVLTTGANWAGPIEDFTLTLDAVEAGSIPLLCWDSAFQQATPTQWTYTARDFVPEQEIKVGFFVPWRP